VESFANFTRSGPAPRGRVQFAPHLTFLLVVIALSLASRTHDDVDFVAPNRSTALCEWLGTRGLSCERDGVTWLEGSRGLPSAIAGSTRALVRATNKGEPVDLYLVDTRLSPEGVLLEATGTYNLTRTSSVDEGPPLVRRARIAYTTSLDGVVTAIHTLDLDGPAPSRYADFTRIQRLQTELTHLQQTGLPRGIVHDAFALDPVAKDVSLSWQDDDTLVASADGRRIVVDAARGVAVDGAGWVRAVPEENARPGGLVPWSVDRVRAMSWFGDNRMQWLKAVVFTALDWILRLRAGLVDTSARDVQNDLGGVNTGSAPVNALEAESAVGWPPSPMTPLVSPTLPGEGKWIALDRDPFITPLPGVHAPFVTSFIRTDKERRDTRVYVTLWDPREIALHMEAGTVEPVSATGEGGIGLVPRAPEIIDHVVAGFNGGFQAMHGEYGMQANGVLYLPPKPYAATVLELRDGSTAFGAWPASATVPDEVLSFRQNLTALVEGGKFNPWGRAWWGGTPPGWQDNVHTTRSGICLTEENYVGYFYGNDIAAEALARAMLAARCSFGMHLDMNPGLAGFEFYDVEPAARFVPLGRPLQTDWEYEGALRDSPGLRLRARRMTRSMVEVNFPQYIHREARDFFYLTTRALLPGSDVESGISPREPGEGLWRMRGLPQHGFPYAVATTTLRPERARATLRFWLLRVDPRSVVPAASPGTTVDTPTVVSFFGMSQEGIGIWLTDGVLVASASAVPGGTRIAAGQPLPQSSAGARAAIGVQDEDGLLDWVELPPEASDDAFTAAAMDSLLQRLGCGVRLLLHRDARAVLGGAQDLGGNATVLPPSPSTRLVRGTPPSARSYFETTPIVPPAVWQPMQSQRVRYFPKPAHIAATTSAPASPTEPEPTDPLRP
jgi:hypothetical protein